MAIHRTTQPKLFTMIVFPSKRRSVVCLALRDCGTLCPDSDSLRRASRLNELSFVAALIARQPFAAAARLLL